MQNLRETFFDFFYSTNNLALPSQKHSTMENAYTQLLAHSRQKKKVYMKIKKGRKEVL